jgi:hypothetical protein
VEFTIVHTIVGTMLMMAGGLNVIVARFGDVLGTNLYDYYGSFTVCVIAITVEDGFPRRV